jgi:hypothetical protein
MLVYRVAVGLNSNYAQLRSNSNQIISKGNPIEIMWEDWGVAGNKINDFIFCVGFIYCKEDVAKELCEKFNTLKTFNIKWTNNPKELAAKNKKKLKWLPKEKPNLKILYTDTEKNILEKSTVTYTIRDGIKYIHKMEGVSEIRGDRIIPREKGKGIYFDKNEINGINIFKPKNSGFVFCDEIFKKHCKEKEYTNVQFLEYGEII